VPSRDDNSKRHAYASCLLSTSRHEAGCSAPGPEQHHRCCWLIAYDAERHVWLEPGVDKETSPWEGGGASCQASQPTEWADYFSTGSCHARVSQAHVPSIHRLYGEKFPKAASRAHRETVVVQNDIYCLVGYGYREIALWDCARWKGGTSLFPGKKSVVGTCRFWLVESAGGSRHQWGMSRGGCRVSHAWWCDRSRRSWTISNNYASKDDVPYPPVGFFRASRQTISETRRKRHSPHF